MFYGGFLFLGRSFFRKRDIFDSDRFEFYKNGRFLFFWVLRWGRFFRSLVLCLLDIVVLDR